MREGRVLENFQLRKCTHVLRLKPKSITILRHHVVLVVYELEARNVSRRRRAVASTMK